MYVVRVSRSKYLRLRYRDPETGVWRQRATKVTRRREANRLAADLAESLAAGTDPDTMDWDEFCLKYEREHLAGLSAASLTGWRTVVNWLDKLEHPRCLSDVDAQLLSRFAAKLRAQGKPNTTIAAYLRPIRAALRWAADLGLIRSAPKIKMPRAIGSKLMRARPITGEEYDRILAAVPKVRPNDPENWIAFLRGLWHSGLRLEELMRLSWHPRSAIRVEPHGLDVGLPELLPCIVLSAAAVKDRRDHVQPITPEFWALLCETPQEERVGPCFPLPNGRTGRCVSKSCVIRTIAQFGREAKVVTQPDTGKFATSHDIGRRAFATRIGRRLSMAELADWMRHKDPSTTLKYYHAASAASLAKNVWP